MEKPGLSFSSENTSQKNLSELIKLVKLLMILTQMVVVLVNFLIATRAK